MGTNNLSIVVCKDASDAIFQGYNYAAPIHLGLELEKVVVIQNGTMSGKPTVDLILKDPQTDQKYIAMITGALLRAIPCDPIPPPYREETEPERRERKLREKGEIE